MTFDLNHHINSRTPQPVADRGICAEMTPVMLTMAAREYCHQAFEHLDDLKFFQKPRLVYRSRDNALARIRDAIRALQDAERQLAEQAGEAG